MEKENTEKSKKEEQEYDKDETQMLIDDWETLLKTKNMTQGQFAQQYGINSPNLSQWKQGKKNSPASVEAVKKFVNENRHLLPARASSQSSTPTSTPKKASLSSPQAVFSPPAAASSPYLKNALVGNGNWTSDEETVLEESSDESDPLHFNLSPAQASSSSTTLNTPVKYADLPAPKSRERKPETPTGRTYTVQKKEVDDIEENTKWPAYLSSAGRNKKLTNFWLYSFNKQTGHRMGDYYSYVKTNFRDLGWMDVGNSSYCIWTDEADYATMRNTVFSATTGHSESAHITYITFIHATPMPTNYSAQFVADYQQMLLQNPNANLAALQNMTHTEGEPNAY